MAALSFAPPRRNRVPSMTAPYSTWNPRRWVVDLLAVWQDTRSIVITAQIAAIYAAILIPFKAGVPIIPGFVELRPANAIPIVASLLFGPPAAWGAGIGNVIGDCFGTLGPASFFGFWGNFFLGYLPFLLWGHLGWLSAGSPPLIDSWRQGLEYILVCLVSSAACAGVIGWGVDWLGLLPFAILASAIFFNNVLMGSLLGPPLLRFLYPRVQRWRLRFEDLQPSSSQWTPVGNRNLVAGKAESATKHPNARSPVPFLDCSKLSFAYEGNSHPVLNQISFSIFPGEAVILLGRSGSGKTTMSYACNGIIPHLVHGQYSGEVRIIGVPTLEEPVWRQTGRVALVFQDFDSQLIATTVEGELRHPLEYRNPPLTREDVSHRMAEALDRVELHIDPARDPITLSGGQRQRLVVASALAQMPSVLVLDDPGSDLDPRGWARLRDVLGKLRDEGLALLVTERSYEELSYADRVLVLDEGAVAWTGHPDDLLRQPQKMRELGLRPPDIPACFEGFDIDPLPRSIEAAWACADAMGLSLEPPSYVTNDELRLGHSSPPPQQVSSNAIQVEGLSFSYGEQMILRDLSFDIRSGEFVAVLGANGSGKSTLARLLNGLLLPTYGRVLIDGLDTRQTSITELARRVGLVFQNPDHQIFAETAWEEVAFGPGNMGCAGEELDQRVREALNAVEFSYEKCKELDPFSLRKGERQRLAVASVLAARPRIFIFDEPTTGLDAAETDGIMRMIQHLNKTGHTVVMITHSMRLVAEYATRCLLMKEGRIVGDEHPRQIFGNVSLVRELSMDPPAIARFSQRWGCTLLTVEEVRASFKRC